MSAGDAPPTSTAAALAHEPVAGAPRRTHTGAVGVHIGGTVCRAAAAFDAGRTWRGALPPGGVDATCETIVAAVREVEPEPRFVVVGTPGHVDQSLGTVSGAANLGEEWAGSVPLRALIAQRLQCEVEIQNDGEVALEAEKRRG